MDLDERAWCFERGTFVARDSARGAEAKKVNLPTQMVIALVDRQVCALRSVL